MATGKKSKPSYLYAIIGISLVLFLLGTLGWLVINGRSLSKSFRENLEVNVNLHDNTRPEMAMRLQEMLDQQPFVKKSRFISKEDALAEVSALEQQDVALNSGFNPLWPQIVLNLHAGYVQSDSLEKISRFIMQSNIVRDVDYPKTVAKSMETNFRRVGYILGAISLLLFITVIILIDNTVRLAMFSNRFLIKTMQMVGATRWFISKPFDQRAIINGFISGLIAAAGLWLIKFFAEANLPELKTIDDPVMMGLLIAVLLILGILISLVSTHRSVVKYLKMRIDDLY